MVWQAVAGIAGSALGAIGARKARKKQERFIKKMMADRAARIKEAKGRFTDSRRGLIEEARASQNAAVQGAQAALMPSMVTTTGGNYLRSIYADAGRRFQEIERQTASGLAELSMLSPYDVVDPSTIGQGLGAEYAAYGGILTGAMGLLGGMMKPSDPYHGGTVSGPGGRQFKTGFDSSTGSYASMPTSGSLSGNTSMAFPGGN